MESVIIYGNGSVARTAYHCLTDDSPYEVKAFTVDRQVIAEQRLLALPVVPFDEVEDLYSPQQCRMFIAVGFGQVNQLRAARFEQAKSKGYSFVSYVSSRATVCSDLVLGQNCLIGANAVIQPSVTTGDNVLIRDNTFVGHDAVIAAHSYIGSGAVILGGAVVGPYSLIGANATIKNGVRVGSACIIGAGVALLCDAADKEVYMNKGAQKLPLRSDQL